MNPTPVSQYNPFDASSPSKKPRFNPYEEKEKRKAAKAVAAAAASKIDKPSDAPDFGKIIEVGKLIAGVVSDLASEKEGDKDVDKDASIEFVGSSDVDKDTSLVENDMAKTVKKGSVKQAAPKAKGIGLFIFYLYFYLFICFVMNTECHWIVYITFEVALFRFCTSNILPVMNKNLFVI